MNKVAKATLWLMIATIVSKILGFGRELVLASAYGASMYSDAYLTAMNIPVVIFASIGTAIATTFIPMYFDVDSNLGEKRALEFTNNILNLVIILCTAISLIGLVFTEQLVKLFAIGFNGEILNITINFTRILLICIVFSGLSSIMASYLQIKNNFTVPGIASVPKNICIIISIILSIKYGVYLMIWGTLIGVCFEFLFQLPFAIKSGYKYKRTIDIKDEYLRKTALLVAPIFIGVSVNQVNAMIDRTLASKLVEGSISALNYAHKLDGFVMALFIASVSSVIYPTLSKLSSEKNTDNFIKTVVSSINSIIILVIPISVGAMTLASPIVKLLFERGEFDSTATDMTAIALIMYSIGMVAFGLRDILGKIFYSLKDTKTPMINGAMTMILNIVLNLILIKYFKHAGLALATSISSIIGTLILFFTLNKKIGYFGQYKIIKTASKTIIAAIVMGIITYFGYNLLSNMLGNGFLYDTISLFSAIILGAIVYGVLIIILKVEEVSIVAEILDKKIVKKINYKNN